MPGYSFRAQFIDAHGNLYPGWVKTRVSFSFAE